jgi:gamma-glutamylcysteine synthetase
MESTEELESRIVAGKPTRTRLSLVGSGSEDAISVSFEEGGSVNQRENEMSDISRNELQALLKANKAEVDAVASAMKTEMANWREQMRSDLRDVKNSVDRQTDKLDSNFNAQQVKLDASIQIQTAKLEKTVSDTRLDIIRWVLGIPALTFTLWKIYEALSS